ncbi:MAG: hypothetical protein RSB00_04180, partial [Bacilli bacterium]
MTNNYFTICSFFYSLLLLIMFFSKKRFESLENKLYSILTVLNFINVVNAILCFITISNLDKVPLLNEIISKILLIVFFVWLTVFTIYIFILSNNNIKKDFENIKYKIIFIIIIIVYFIIIGLIIFLPLKYYSQNGIAYSYGPSANIVYVVCGTYIILWLIMAFKNYKNIKNKKYLPMFMFILIVLIVVPLQKKYPGLLLITAAETFITFLMYFTIENPDLKMMRALNLAKE